MVDVDPFAAAEDAHGAANPESHKWLKNAAERYLLAFLHFEDCETREGKVVETIVGRLKDGTYSREWLFPPDDPDSRGWRAQELEFIESIRSELKSGDILVMELGAERPSIKNPDRSVRPFRGTHHPVATQNAVVAGDEATETAHEAERNDRETEVSEVGSLFDGDEGWSP